MIHKIRKRHKIIWLILAVLLPLLFIAAIAFRHIEPVNENVPERVFYKSPASVFVNRHSCSFVLIRG